MNTAEYTIDGGDYERGGAASKSLKEMLKKIGVDPQALRRTMVAAYEAEMNVVIHAHRGVMKVAVDPAQVDVVITDEGPGIPDIEQAMREGFSTAPSTARELGFGAGMGLPNIQRNTDHFSIQSTPGDGTQMRFTILLKPQETGAAAPNSVHVDAARCQQCLMCLRACPTAAIRVRAHGPRILDHLCVDCTSCIAVCEARALSMRCPDPIPAPSEETQLVLPPSFMEQFGPGITPERILDALAEMGFRNVRQTDEWEDALRYAVHDYAKEGGRPRPTLSPVCPAIVNLVQVRFPSLLGNIAPFRSPVDAAREEITAPHVVFAPVCPSQQTLLRGQRLLSRIDVAPPLALVNTVAERLGSQGRPAFREKVVATETEGVLQVSGMKHVIKMLDAVENGLLFNYAVLELYACDQGCFGSPLWSEDPLVARSRWTRELDAAAPGAKSIRRTAPLRSRPGLRLDADMGKAMEKLARIDALTKSLPGRNCGVCGAPTCAALAEDVVMGRAELSACTFLNVKKGEPS